MAETMIGSDGNLYIDRGDGNGFQPAAIAPDQASVPEGYRLEPSAPGFAFGPGGAVAQLDVTNGQWTKPSKIQTRFLKGVGQGVGESLSNTAQFLGLPEHVQDLLTDPVSALSGAPSGPDPRNQPENVARGRALGTGGQMAAASALGGWALPALSTSLGLAINAPRALPFMGELAGAFGAAFASADEGEGLGVGAENLQDDLTMSGILAASSKVLHPAVRIMSGIFRRRPKVRDVELGEFGEPGQAAASRLQEQGFELKPGQAVGTKKEIGIDDQFQSDPKSRGEFDAIDAKNQKLLDQGAARSLGVDETEILEPTRLGQIGEEIGDEIEAVVESVGGIKIDAKAIEGVKSTVSGPGVDGKTKTAVGRWSDELLESADENGVVSPTTWRVFRQDMVAYRNSVKSFDSEKLGKTLEEWDELPVASMRASKDPNAEQFLQTYGESREKYRNFLVLSDGRAVDANGHVRSKIVKQRMKNVFGETFTLAKESRLFNDTSRDFQRTIRDLNNPRMLSSVGDSGTATRLAKQFDEDRNLESVAEIASGQPGRATANLAMRVAGGIAPGFRLAPKSDPFGIGLGAFAGSSFADLLVGQDE